MIKVRIFSNLSGVITRPINAARNKKGSQKNKKFKQALMIPALFNKALAKFTPKNMANARNNC
ncbi:MAG: hypothetical protein HC784_18235 [Hydrococcus sp. CSU_1_8]|nr:hypothetical protein [Hydrococcus sp. CSU_1_8]